jgi:hypothetical protein
VFLALVFATAGIGADSSLSLFSPAPFATIGSEVPVTATLAGGSDFSVYLFAGTEGGTTAVFINGVKVHIPVAGIVFEAGTATSAGQTAAITAAIPNDSALLGAKITWVAVVVDNVTRRVIAIARTGGPIIEDAIC